MEPIVNVPMFIKRIMLVFLFITPFLFYGQNKKGNDASRKTKPNKYHYLAVTDTISTIKLTDFLRYTDGYASKKNHKIVPCSGYEAELIAYGKSFGIVLREFCWHSDQDTIILCAEQGPDQLTVGIRCFVNADSYIGTLSNAPAQYCMPCYSVLRNDTIMAYYYEPLKSITVVRFYKKGKHYVMDTHPIEATLDECGVMYLEIPRYEESYFAFYNSSPYLCWIHFVPNDITRNN